MPISTKRWDDPIDVGTDGTRILVCRYRPRALKKCDETWTEWIPELGPSKELHAAAYGKNGMVISWASYRSAYLTEMRAAKTQIKQLADRVRSGESITLLCSSSCIQESRCHRSLLKMLIESDIARASATTDQNE